MKNYLTNVFWGPADRSAFYDGIQKAIDQLPPAGIFAGDNLFTFGRNLGFLDDPSFMTAVDKHAENDVERSVIWRNYVLCWAARRALRLEGDFVECGCYKGVTARIVADAISFGTSGRLFYLYDLFDHTPEMTHQRLPDHSPDLYASVCQRFADMSNVKIIKGRVPESFEQGLPDKIAFLHIDMNNAEAEINALEAIFDRVTPGAVVMFDDYGWLAYRAQKQVEDRFFAKRGLQILELPTGQGLVIV